MTPSQMIFLGMTVAAFLAFMVALAYGSLAVLLWERSQRRGSHTAADPTPEKI